MPYSARSAHDALVPELEARPAARNAFVCGMPIAIISVLALSKSYDWEEYINLAVGLWVSIAPWALGFADSAIPTWTHVGIGLAVARPGRIRELAAVRVAPGALV